MERLAGSSQETKITETERENRPVKRGVKEKQGRREEREKRSFQGSAIKIKRSTTSCLFLPFWFYQCFLTLITLDADLSLLAGFPSWAVTPGLQGAWYDPGSFLAEARRGIHALLLWPADFSPFGWHLVHKGSAEACAACPLPRAGGQSVQEPPRPSQEALPTGPSAPQADMRWLCDHTAAPQSPG